MKGFVIVHVRNFVATSSSGLLNIVSTLNSFNSFDFIQFGLIWLNLLESILLINCWQPKSIRWSGNIWHARF